MRGVAGSQRVGVAGGVYSLRTHTLVTDTIFPTHSFRSHKTRKRQAGQHDKTSHQNVLFRLKAQRHSPRSTSPSDVFRKSPPCVRRVDLRSFSHFSREQPRALLLQTPAKTLGTLEDQAPTNCPGTKAEPSEPKPDRHQNINDGGRTYGFQKATAAASIAQDSNSKRMHDVINIAESA